MRRMGPLAAGHPLIQHGDRCPACEQPFVVGQYVTLIILGPGDDPEAQEKARAGLAYNAVADPVHWACATGESV